MLLKDPIKESAGESRELFTLARKLTRAYATNPRREYSLSDWGTWNEPSVQELASKVKVKFDSRFDHSLYNPRTKEVLIKVEDGVNLESVLVHELQHALDDIKSQGRFRRERGDYQTRQSEVNARLSQAVADIEAALQKVKLKNVDWQDPKIRPSVEKLIQSYLKKHKLGPQQGIALDRYQKLIKRIYKYILAHYQSQKFLIL